MFKLIGELGRQLCEAKLHSFRPHHLRQIQRRMDGVWKENRERLVGYPHRDFEFRPGSKDWAYTMDSRSKSYSMILTGAAFFHKVVIHSNTLAVTQFVSRSAGEIMDKLAELTGR
ncbi:uncharacterized protein DEA37_0003919 [Paragonimus westermani]|uniref:Glycosyl transferase 64 domain-containing protein n=1 Tax=Paragonimus westermani TaxID=34504 RepID=A0A5J4N6H9_9TREM|nr:uncharacterized protein DEA37_0003919 [Paragonimus westermani]